MKYKASTNYVTIGDEEFVLYHTKGSGIGVLDDHEAINELMVSYAGNTPLTLSGGDIILDRLYWYVNVPEHLYYGINLENLQFFNLLWENQFFSHAYMDFEYGEGQKGHATISDLYLTVVPDSAIPAVPEPSSWLFMLMGFAGIATAHRRRGRALGAASAA